MLINNIYILFQVIFVLNVSFISINFEIIRINNFTIYNSKISLHIINMNSTQ